MKRIHFVLIAFVFILAFFLRFNNLDKIPPALQQDETSIGYNAYSILLTGKDEYGQKFPLYFKAFGEYKLPGYIYASVIPIKIFGLNEIGVRFISAFSGSMTVVVFFFLLRKLTKKDFYLSFTASLFLAINPWHLQFSRGAFEVTLALFLILTGLYCFIISLEKNKSLFLFISVILFSASIYTYNIARIFSPLLFIYLVYIFREQLFQKTKIFILSIILFLILILPFVLNIFSKGGLQAASGTLIFSSNAVKAPLIEFRSYVIEMPFTKIFFNSFALLIFKYIENIISYFSVSFFFVSGPTHGNHGIGNVGNMYLFDFPLLVLGLIYVFKNKTKWENIFIFWTISAILIAALTRDVPQASRSFFLTVPFAIFSAMGFLYSLKFLGMIKNSFYKIAVIAIVFCFIFYNILYYFTSYYVRFPLAYAKQWRLGDKEVVEY